LLALPGKSFAQPAGEPSIQQRLAGEVARLRQIAAAQPESELWKQPGVEAVMSRVTQDVEAGRLLVALRGLASLRTNVEAYAFLADHPQVAAGEQGAFKAEWQRMDGELRRIEQAYRQSPQRPAGVRALGEATWLRSHGARQRVP
jgi:HAMP domain-containing protein